MNHQSPSIPPELTDEWIEIGKIVAPQGMKGEVRVYPYSDFPDRFLQPGERWLLHPDNSQPEPVQFLSGRFLENKGIYVVQIEGIGDRTHAEALRGSLLLVPESDRPPLEADEFHVRDLIGLEVYHSNTKEFIGTVVDFIPAGNDLLAVRPHPTDNGGNNGKNSGQKNKKPQDILIPFVMEIVPLVDLEVGRVEINPPPGLLDINRIS
ncbi:ribosome maturation factor RimM [Phormidium sp. CCY1219]|uniref:ribosome maturation factor RimM n=1 Tax=Phormidium sp. CCY1219 TaxID=2886104 RepID=UPI002D1F3510|nr:ribosome maturation factor RimM [Phormidium sp. CCY1219]MEB3829406.1 ribosome maturation factor RimM [Phormidium sp. CCY1219]